MKIKHIRSDNGTEFKNSGLDEYLVELGITHELFAAYTPQQNGVVERKNRTLVEMARTMLDEYKTPRHFWIEAIYTACHIINRVYLHKFFKKTAYELLTEKKLNVSYFKVFEGFRREDLYIVNFSTGPQPAICLLAKASEGWLWHRRLDHAGMRNLHTLAKKKHVIGIENVKFLKDHLCGACEAGKMTKAKHPAKTIMTTTRPFELLHMDLFGANHYSAEVFK